MSEELQKQLAEMLARLTSAVESGAAFAGDQVPLLVQEKILLGRIEHVALFAGCAAVVWFAVKYGRSNYAKAEAAGSGRYGIDSWPERPGGLLGIGCAILGFMAAGVAVYQLRAALLAWLAPRLYVVEWLRSFL